MQRKETKNVYYMWRKRKENNKSDRGLPERSLDGLSSTDSWKRSVLSFALVVWMPGSVTVELLQAAIKYTRELLLVLLMVVVVILHGWSSRSRGSSDEEGYIGRSVYGRKPLKVMRHKRRWRGRIGLKGPPIETSKAAGRRHRKVQVVVNAAARLRRSSDRDEVGNKWEMLKLRTVMSVVMLPGHIERGDNRHCLRNRAHPQMDLSGESGRVMGPGRRRQPQKPGAEVIHRCCCLVEQNGLAAAAMILLMMLSRCGRRIVVVSSADAGSEKLSERSILLGYVVVYVLLVSWLDALFLFVLGGSLPRSLPGLRPVHPNLRPGEGQPRSLAGLGSTRASRFRQRKVLALIPGLALILVVILIELNLRRIKSATLAARPLLVAELLRRVGERRIVQRRELRDGIGSGFDQPLNCFAGLVVTQPILEIIELNSGGYRQADPPVSQPFWSPHLAVPIFAAGCSGNADDAGVVPPAETVARISCGGGGGGPLEV